ncbi:MAG: hypothetical protein ACRCYG_18645, partial [Aeromonas veronii]
LDIYRAGSLLDAWVNHFTLTLSVPDMVDYLDSNGYQHHVAKVAIINSDGSVTDVRRKRTIELAGDVSGKGILEDALGVTIAVEIKDGSHRHKWGELDDVPELALKRHRHPWENIDEVPAGLGTYAAATTNVATQLREKSGFYNASNAANGMPFGSEWKYYFNVAHANAGGYNGMNGLDFAGSEMGFATVENGIFKGWRQLWHSESKRIQVKADANPMFEMHIPGKHAAAMELESNGAIQWWSTNGAGGWAKTIASLTPGAFEVYGGHWAANNSHGYGDQWANTAPFHVNFGLVAGSSDYYPIVRGKNAVNGQGYTTQVELGILREGGPTWGHGILMVRSGEGNGPGSPSAIYRFDWGGNFYAPGAVHDAGQRVYSPNREPHYSHVHTAAQGNQDIVAGGVGQIGTYGFFFTQASGAYGPGTTLPGSSLRWSSTDMHESDWGGGSPAGTWKLVGYYPSNAWTKSLWIRIA